MWGGIGPSIMLGRLGVFGASGPTAGAILGVDGFSTANYYSGAGLAGGSTTSRSVLVRVDAVPSGTEAIFSRWATNGWTLGADASGFFFRVSTTLSPQRAIGAGDVGKWFLLTGTFDGSTIRLYVNGTEVGSGTALGSGGIAVAGGPALGRQIAGTAGQGAVSFAACAAGGTDAEVKSAAQVSSIYDAAFLAGDLANADWAARYSVADDGGGVPSPLTDQVGTLDYTLSGTLTAVSEASPTWGTA